MTVGLIPNSPSNLVITQQTVYSEVHVAWSTGLEIGNNPITLGYKVYLDDLNGNLPIIVFDTTNKALVTSTTITGLIVGKTYHVTASASNIIGESLPSAVLTVHVGVLPSKIVKVVLKSSTTTSLLIGWAYPLSNGGLSLTQYTVYLDVGQTGATTSTIAITNTLQNYIDATLLTTGVKVDV